MATTMKKNYEHQQLTDLFTADIISCVEFNQDGELLATGDKGGRVVIFQVSYHVKETIFNLQSNHTFQLIFSETQRPRAVYPGGGSTTSIPPSSLTNQSSTT